MATATKVKPISVENAIAKKYEKRGFEDVEVMIDIQGGNDNDYDVICEIMFNKPAKNNFYGSHHESSFQFSVQALPFCCGMIEFGNLQIESENNAKNIIEKEDIIDLIRETILRVRKKLHEGSKRKDAIKKIIVNLIPAKNMSSRWMEEALIELGDFGCIAEFRNTSGNKIKTYLSE